MSKGPYHKPCWPDSNLHDHIVGENPLQKLSSDLQMHAVAHAHTQNK